MAAGNISLPWRPETDVLTVHKLLVRRGDQIIDILKSGQTFTVTTTPVQITALSGDPEDICGALTFTQLGAQAAARNLLDVRRRFRR